jgi:RsiW-degrading membrane proteinase PrsW (M82 family)
MNDENSSSVYVLILTIIGIFILWLRRRQRLKQLQNKVISISDDANINGVINQATSSNTQTSSVNNSPKHTGPLDEHLADHITSRLGLERIENFSIKKFFSESFKRHSVEEVEQMLIVGTSTTSPAVNSSMSVMPNPWLFFWVFTRALIVYLILLFSWNYFKEINVLPGLMFVGSFVIPFSVLILFFELNTPKNISIFKVIQLTFIGGVISILITFFLYSAFPNIVILGAPSAGIIEEVAKLTGLIVILNAANEDRYPYRLNGLLLGAAVGTGFAAFESAGYALQSFSEVNRTMLDSIHLRALLSPFAHIAWTAIAASAYWIARKTHHGVFETITSWQFLKLFFISVSLHMIWNMNFTGPYLIKYWFLGFVSWVVIISLVQSGLKELSLDNQKS